MEEQPKENLNSKSEGKVQKPEEDPEKLKAEEELAKKAIEEGGVRKLAAIMFTDIKGFSKKMGENEEAAMQILQTHDTMVKNVVAKYGGKVIKSIGDSFMVDFSSAVNAVRCAIEAQENFWKYSEGKSEFEKIQIRIGIHLGDVITLGNDIFGDGVNIASRIEAITEPNRITISQDVYNQVKNKMNLQAASFGYVELKNIAEPVEVYQVLIESIPQLAKPSNLALQIPVRKKAEAITREQAEEAKRIEAAKKKAEEERRRAEEEKQKKVQEHYNKAEEFFQQGNYDGAQAEIKEIYKLVAIHHGARKIQLQIEEERRRREEAEKKAIQERNQQIKECLQRSKQLLKEEKFDEALVAIGGIYTRDPQHPEAKSLEEQIRQAQREKLEKKAEAEKLQTTAVEQKVEAPQTGPLSEVGAETATAGPPIAEKKKVEPAKVIKPPTPIRKSKFNKKLTVGIVALLVMAVVVYLGFQHFQKTLLKSTSLAVLPFKMVNLQADEDYLGEALAGLISAELAQYENFLIISSTSTSFYKNTTADLPQLAGELQIRYFLLGEVQQTDQKLSLVVKLVDSEKRQTLWSANFEKDFGSISDIQLEIVKNVSQQLGMEVSIKQIQNPTASLEAYELYLRGQWYIERPSIDAIESGTQLLQQAVALDPAFSLAHAASGSAALRKFKLGGEKDKKLLNEAVQRSQHALNLNPSVALAYETIGEAYQYLHRFDDAAKNLHKSLTLNPGSPECYRQLALLEIIKGDYDEALDYASKAMQIDPKHPDSHIVLGLVNHFKKQYVNAVKSYQNAIVLASRDSLVTIRYLFSAWGEQDQHDRVASYSLQLLDHNLNDFRIYYWIGRAHQLSGHVEESIKYLRDGLAVAQKAIRQNPNNANAHAYLGLIYTRLGKFSEGQAETKKAFALDSLNAEAMYKTAGVYSVQGKKSNALTWLKKAVATEYQFSEILDIDLFSIADDPEFASIITRKSQTRVDVSN